MKKKIFLLFFIFLLLLIYIILCANSYALSINSNISSSLIRLHIIANSNSIEDQNLKILIRDSLLDYMNSLLNNNYYSKDEALEIISNHLNEFKLIAQETVYKNGYNYPIEIELGNFSFPTKSYGDISIPSGYYDAVRVKIGNSEGNNWWCVMFPPLCFVDINSGIVPEDSKKLLENNLDEEEYKLISENKKNNLKIKFKIIELINNYKHNSN